MSKILHDDDGNDNAKAIAIHQVFYEDSQANKMFYFIFLVVQRSSLYLTTEFKASPSQLD